MPITFDKLGISFQYPDNWELDDSDARLGRRSVTVYSPGGAFWSISLHSGSIPPKKLTSAVLEAMKEEYNSLEVEDINEVVAGRELSGYDFAFYCFDLTNTATVRSVKIAHTTYVIFCQAEDREYEQVREVFRAITASLLGNLIDLNGS